MRDNQDANKTPLTHRATATAAAHLHIIGCKPIETEVAICSGWVADLASYWYPTCTEGKKFHLDRRARELLGLAKDATVPAENLVPRAYGTGPFTVLVEVKTTKQDFVRDARKWDRFLDWPAHICILAFPTGVVAKDEVPNGWYGLELSRDGTRVRTLHRSWGSPHPQHSGCVVDFIAAVGIRRDHRTSRVALRAFLKAHRACQQETKVRHCAGHLLNALADWLRGQGVRAGSPLADALAASGTRKLPEYCRQAISFFESLREARRDERT